MTMSYRFDHIALLVRDLDESVAFLTAVLGLTPSPDCRIFCLRLRTSPESIWE